MDSKLQLVFIFSLPRSGSTLLQRLLMSHSKIQSTAEPWLLFPYMQFFDFEGVVSKYSIEGTHNAVNDFFSEVKDGREVLLDELRAHILKLYSLQCNEEHVFFLDKTPRYYHYIDQIRMIFPEARFVFLFRNPISIINSILKTFCRDSFRYFPRYYHDVFTGFGILSNAYQKHKDKSLALSYERLVENLEDETGKLLNFLNLEGSINVEEALKITFGEGRMGDPTGQYILGQVSTKGIDSWKHTKISKLRLKVYKGLLNRYDKEVFRIQGYSKEHLLYELLNVPSGFKGSFKDWIGWITCRIILKTKINLLFGRNKSKWYLS